MDEIHVDESPYRGTLLTASTTTGWLDWIHGELWLFPYGLLRIPLDLNTTYAHGVGPTIGQGRPTQRVFDPATFQKLTASRKHVWVACDGIQEARFHHGILTDRLALTLREGRSVTFLWLAVDSKSSPLVATLREWLWGFGKELIIE